EVARQLRQQGRTVALLAVLDTRAQSLPSLISEVPTCLRRLRQERDRLSYLSPRIPIVRRRILRALWRTVRLWYRWGGWLPSVLQNVKAFTRSTRAAYVPETFDGHVALFRAENEAGLRDPLMG